MLCKGGKHTAKETTEDWLTRFEQEYLKGANESRVRNGDLENGCKTYQNMFVQMCAVLEANQGIS